MSLDAITQYLETFGLTLPDMQARLAGEVELSLCNMESMGEAPAFVVPYYSIGGRPLTFYRVLRTSGGEGGQPHDEPNHIYFPPGLPEVVRQQHHAYRNVSAKEREEGKRPYLLLAQGELRAAMAVKRGIPCIGISGVFAWKNRVIRLPGNANIRKTQKGLRVRIPSNGMGAVAEEEDNDTLTGMDEHGLSAVGLADVANFCIMQDWDLIMVMDTEGTRIHPNVQKAMATLGYDLRQRGLRVTRIRQWPLPGKSGRTTGLDTVLMEWEPEEIQRAIRRCQQPSMAFPRHPTPREYIDYQLRGKLGRKQVQNISLTILTELEARGTRMRTRARGDLCYFDHKSLKLMPVRMGRVTENLFESDFGALLYDRFCVSGNDSRVVSWLGTLFTGEPGVREVDTHRVIARSPEDEVILQISDTHYVRVTPDPNNPLEIHGNGDRNILFESGHVNAIDPHQLEAKFVELLDKPIEPVWKEVWDTFDFRVPQMAREQMDRYYKEGLELPTPCSEEDIRKLMTTLYYLSPWLQRWRGAQLPIEIIVGSAGSGKSSICELRQTILKGKTSAANITRDLRDFHATIGNEGALLVLDNLNMSVIGSDLQQQISDEFCRLLTERVPHIEKRKLYSTNSLEVIPVTTNVVVTSITRPFDQEDLMQRAAYVEVVNVRNQHDSYWIDHQLQRMGGRVGWLAHHLVVLHTFLREVVWKKRWNENYKTIHRLNHYEQTVRVMASILGLGDDWVPEAVHLARWYQGDSYQAINPQDKEEKSTLMGLWTFTDDMRRQFPKDYEGRRYTAKDISFWARSHPTYQHDDTLTNPVKLGRYLALNRYNVKKTAKLVYLGLTANRKAYRILRPSKPAPRETSMENDHDPTKTSH